MRTERERIPSPLDRGDQVEVTEPGIRPWTGVVTSVKWSPVSGWWADIDSGQGRTVIVGLEGHTEWRRLSPSR